MIYMYLVSYGILNPMEYMTLESIFIHHILNPLIEKLTSLYGKLNPHGILNPLISNQEIVGGFNILIGGGQYSI